MRILVVSDSHGDYNTLLLAIKSQPLAQVVIHCGDGNYEMEKMKEKFPEKLIVSVRGNCDLSSQAKINQLLTIANKKIFVSHGYKEQVKFSLSQICYKAKSLGADILLFGHTHDAFMDYDDGLYIMNPGTLKGIRGSYGIIDIENNGVVLNIIPTETLYK